MGRRALRNVCIAKGGMMYLTYPIIQIIVFIIIQYVLRFPYGIVGNRRQSVILLLDKGNIVKLLVDVSTVKIMTLNLTLMLVEKEHTQSVTAFKSPIKTK